MIHHQSIDFGNRPPTGRAAPPRRGELAFASSFKKWPSSSIESAADATNSPASCPSILPGTPQIPAKNGLLSRYRRHTHDYSQVTENQQHSLNGSKPIKPNQTLRQRSWLERG
jgi:hypothetical protein